MARLPWVEVHGKSSGWVAALEKLGEGYRDAIDLVAGGAAQAAAIFDAERQPVLVVEPRIPAPTLPSVNVDCSTSVGRAVQPVPAAANT